MLTALRILVALALLAVLAVAVLWGIRLAGYGYLLAGSQEQVEPVRPDIPFAPLTDDALHDPDNPPKVFRVDMARVEHDFPLTRAQLASLTPANLLALSQEEVDRMIKDAETHRGEDAALRERVDARNELDSVAYRVRKALDEAGAAVPQHDRARAELLVEEARQAVEGDEPVDRLRALTGELHQMSQVLSATARSGGGPSTGSAKASEEVSDSDDDDVIDAEFTSH